MSDACRKNTYRQATMGREADARFSLRIGCSSGIITQMTMSEGRDLPLMAAASAGYRLDTGYRVRYTSGHYLLGGHT